MSTQPPKIDPRFIYLGTAISNNDLSGNRIAISFPSEGPFQTSRAVNAARNINGAVVGQMVGRSIDKQNMTWKVLKRELWWSINRFFETNGMYFYCKYFAHNVGKWLIRRFYCGDVSCEPYKINANDGVPDVYLNCTVNVIDMGEDDTIVVSTMPLS